MSAASLLLSHSHAQQMNALSGPLPLLVHQERVDFPDAEAAQHCFEDLAQISAAHLAHLQSETVLSERVKQLQIPPLHHTCVGPWACTSAV